MKKILALALRRKWIVCVCVALGCARFAAGDDAKEVKLEDLALKIPAGWKQQKPSSNLRLGQFEIPAVEGDKEPAELAVFNFGADGGGVKANVTRWIDQFAGAGRKSKTTMGKCAQGEYVLVDISGTYNKSIGPPIAGRTQPTPGSRMLGVIIGSEKKGNYFLKLTGPDKTVAAAAAAFRTSFGGDEKAEKPWEAEKTE